VEDTDLFGYVTSTDITLYVPEYDPFYIPTLSVLAALLLTNISSLDRSAR